jgi:hypothetical protein
MDDPPALWMCKKYMILRSPFVAVAVALNRTASDTLTARIDTHIAKATINFSKKCVRKKRKTTQSRNRKGGCWREGRDLNTYNLLFVGSARWQPLRVAGVIPTLLVAMFWRECLPPPLMGLRRVTGVPGMATDRRHFWHHLHPSLQRR